MTQLAVRRLRAVLDFRQKERFLPYRLRMLDPTSSKMVILSDRKDFNEEPVGRCFVAAAFIVADCPPDSKPK